MADSFAERLAQACATYQTTNPMTADESAVFYYPEDAVVHLEGEFTARQLRALLEAMGEATR
jgi:hypothetical protein